MNKNTTTHPLTHADGCPDSRRVETTSYPEMKIDTHHCIDCGAHVAVRDDGTVKPAPTTPGPFNRDDGTPGIFDGITTEPTGRAR